MSALGPTRTRLRQIALVAEDLEKAKRQLTEIIGTEVVFVNPSVGQWGLKNFLVAIGGDIIEIVSPFQPNTSAGRLLLKRGDGGYMIIMQTGDASARRSYIESKGLSKVIWGYDHDGVVCVQYHPKGIKGGILPELDSQPPSPNHPDPLSSTFSPWHACGPDYASYSAGMKRRADISLKKAVCRLAPGDTDTQAAARQWEKIFGVPRDRDQLAFTNAQVEFKKGEEGNPEGLESITIAVKGEKRFHGILERASKAGLCGNGWINMVGIKWYFLLEKEDGTKSLL